MIIKSIVIEPRVKIKIYNKHSVIAEEIENVLKNKALFKRVSGNKYLAIGLWNRYITIIFKYNEKEKKAIIVTAYPSDIKQIRYFKKRR